MSLPETDPNESKTISGADFALLCDQAGRGVALENIMAAEAAEKGSSAITFVHNAMRGGYSAQVRGKWHHAESLSDAIDAAIAANTPA